MTAAHRKLVRFVLAAGATVSVDDGNALEDGPAVEKSTNRKEIVDAIESVSSADIYVHVDGRREWALIISSGVDDDETVADCSCGGLIDQWFGKEG